MPQASISAVEVSKSYGSLVALDSVSHSFFPGQVHAVLGENGAGKSTLMGVLGGFVVPSAGVVSLEGLESFPAGSPYAVRRLGVGMVHQHFALVPDFTVAENLALAAIQGLATACDPMRLAQRAAQISHELGWELSLSARTSSLPVGLQQRIEILKLLASDAHILIFDEPTAALSPDEVGELLPVFQRLASAGKTVILIAHKLREVLAVADHISVLRHGRLVASMPRSEATEDILSEAMVGERVEPSAGHTQAIGDVVVKATHLTALGDRGNLAVTEASFAIRAGEVLGFGGVEGNGQNELAEVLAGVRVWQAGELQAPDAGYVPGDRRADGLALEMTVQENLMLGAQRDADLGRRWTWNMAAVREWAIRLISRFGIKTSSPKAPITSLSGGNQQKVVVARNLYRQQVFLVAVNPTRGLDFRASQTVHEEIRQAAAHGTAVALFSTDWDEVAELSNRVITMASGRAVAP